jgi:hypothetical protein
MGWTLIVSIVAMTSFMTMVQLIALTLSTPPAAPHASTTVQIAKSVPAKSDAKKSGKTVTPKSAKHHRRHVRRRGAQAVTFQQHT